MKRVLIICPHFPPLNAADMHRVRMNLWYFRDFGWEAEVVTVNPVHSDIVIDTLLLKSVPKDVKVHFVEALPKKWTSKIGLGSLAIRSLWFYRKYVDRLLKTEKFDLLFFSTTQFPLCILGRHWKRKFAIPYIIDMQDPWHSDYYQDKPPSQRPKKYWFSYRLNKYLEPVAMKSADGIMSVSSGYIEMLHTRYPKLRNKPSQVITFGAFEKDFAIATENASDLKPAFKRENDTIHLVYVGRGGFDMQKAVSLLFVAFKQGLAENYDVFSHVRFHFIGTSYAPNGMGEKTILPMAALLNISEYVSEQTGRIGFYESIRTLQHADGLIVPGSDDPNYTASKIFPYILARKPLFALLHPESSAATIINSCRAGEVVTLKDDQASVSAAFGRFMSAQNEEWRVNTDWSAFDTYTAREMTRKQAALFDRVCDL